MNNSQKILIAIGGVTVLAALVLGYFIWDAAAAKSEKTEELESGIDSARNVVKKLSVGPTDSELKVYRDNAEGSREWCAQAMKLICEGDLVYEPTTEAALKAQMVADAHKFAALPGTAGGKLVKGDFGFGFAEYITGGKLPAKADLKRIQREWADVSSVIATLAESGALEIVDVRMAAAGATAAQEEQADGGKSKRKSKSRQKPNSKAKKDEDGKKLDAQVTKFAIDFLARPAAFVKAVDAFATAKRFIVVDNFSFVRSADAISAALGGGERKEERQGSSRRRRRGRDVQVEAEKSDSPTGPTMVIDPVTEPPMKITMEFSVYDFRSLEKGAEENSGEVAK